MKSYRRVHPLCSGAIITINFLIAISIVACDADPTDTTAVDSVSAADDESDEESPETNGEGTTSDTVESAAEKNGTAEGVEKDERSDEDDESSSILEELTSDPLDIDAMAADAMDRIDADEIFLDEDNADDSTEDPKGSGTRCPPETRCADGADATTISAFGEPEIDGPIERDDLETGFRRTVGQLNGCARTIDAAESRTGKLTLEWRIEDRDSVARATNPEVTESTFEDEAFHECLENVIKGTPFPGDGSQKSDIGYPLEF